MEEINLSPIFDETPHVFVFLKMGQADGLRHGSPPFSGARKTQKDISTSLWPLSCNSSAPETKPRTCRMEYRLEIHFQPLSHPMVVEIPHVLKKIVKIKFINNLATQQTSPFIRSQSISIYYTHLVFT